MANFRKGNTIVQDIASGDCPATVTSENIVEQVCILTAEERWLIVEEIGANLRLRRLGDPAELEKK